MFRLDNKDPSGARAGRLKTAHGEVKTPFYMPVATKGTVKTLLHDDVISMGYESLISNAFVLFLRPGLDVIEGAGGLHKFMGWDRTIFTDSGGFQMLNPDFLHSTNDSAVTFKSPFDQSRHKMNPEKCIEIQNRLGSDVAMVIDALIPFGSAEKDHSLAVERTTEWARRCREAHEEPRQLLFAITQGGTNLELRKRSARALTELEFDGYAIGGLSIGEPKEVMHRIMSEQDRELPIEKPRYLMGLGSPIEMLEAIERGVDCFDSTFPTRNARHNDAYTFMGDFNISRGRFKRDHSPIEEGCPCYACKNHTRAYVHHLLRTHEVSGQALMTIHNLFFMKRLLNEARTAIMEDDYQGFKRDFIAGYTGPLL